MKLTTNNLPDDQPGIEFEIESEASELARWIVTYLESQVHAAARFRDGQTIELGWSLLLLRQTGEVLEVFEPDFDSIPIRWCRGVNNTVRHLQIQRAVCDLLCCEPEFPGMCQAGIVSPTFAESESCTMSRDAPADTDSGWVFAETGYGGAEGEFCSLYQLALQKIEIVPFLALPPSSRVFIKPGLREVTVNSLTKSSLDSKLLRDLAGSPVLV